MDLSKLSDADLQALQSGNLKWMSSEGLAQIAGEQEGSTQDNKPSFVDSVSSMLKQKGIDALSGLIRGGPVGMWAGLTANDAGQKSIKEGALTGAASIGNTLLAPVRYGVDQLAPKQTTVRTLITGEKTRPDSFLGGVGNYLDQIPEASKAIDASNQDSPLYTPAKVGTQILLTAPVGGAVGEAIGSAAPYAGPLAPTVSKLASSVGSGGTVLGGAKATTLAGKAGNMALRVAGGAANGALSTGLVNPSDASTGALIGGALPPVVASLGAVGNAVKNSFSVTPEVASLAQRAQELGIDIPADRLANSKPLNALAATLNYVPFSGRAATEANMSKQLNTALSRTFGQESDNVTMALRRAQGDLGAKFDDVLRNNTIKVDPQFVTDLADSANKAARELGSDGASIIGKQVDDIISKAANGEIDGQAAYNIKKTLDRIGNRNTPEAFYARDLKSALMGALDRSLGPEQSAAFAQTRRQYGNMLALENLAQNGAEGGVSIGRLANMKNINNPDLQELADISAQFLKSREGQHGAMQRLMIGGVGAGAGGVSALPYLAGASVSGRVANAALNSDKLRTMMIKNAASPKGLLGGPSPDEIGLLSQSLVRSAPVLLGVRRP